MSGRARNSTERPLRRAVVYRQWQIWRTSVLWCWAWSLRGVLALLLLLFWTLQHTQKNNTQAVWQMYVHIRTQNTCSILCLLCTPTFEPTMYLFISLILAFPAEYTVQAYWVRSIQADIRMNTKPCDVCLCFDVKWIGNQLSNCVDSQAWLYTKTKNTTIM